MVLLLSFTLLSLPLLPASLLLPSLLLLLAVRLLIPTDCSLHDRHSAVRPHAVTAVPAGAIAVTAPVSAPISATTTPGIGDCALSGFSGVVVDVRVTAADTVKVAAATVGLRQILIVTGGAGGGGGGGGEYSLVACLRSLKIDRACISRLSTVPTLIDTSPKKNVFDWRKRGRGVLVVMHDCRIYLSRTKHVGVSRARGWGRGILHLCMAVVVRP